MSLSTQKPAYRRVLLKLSGEMLQGDRHGGIDLAVLERVTHELIEVAALGTQLGVVVGGGNFCRGNDIIPAHALPLKKVIDRLTADHMGMLATVMNGLALASALQYAGQRATVFSALPLSGVCEVFNAQQARRVLEEGHIAIFVGGTGNPCFTTDTAASLRAIEIAADILLKATKVNGVYSADPLKYPDAVRFERLSFSDVLVRQLGVMDLSAICLCRDHHLPIRVFDFHQQQVLYRILTGANEGTLVSGDEL